MADIDMYRRSWDDFLEAYGKVAQRNRTLIDLVCDMADQLGNYEPNETTDELMKRYSEVMDLNGNN